jgi:hypothetical protein
MLRLMRSMMRQANSLEYALWIWSTISLVRNWLAVALVSGWPQLAL